MMKVTGLLLLSLVAMVASLPVQIANVENKDYFKSIGHGINGVYRGMKENPVPSLLNFPAPYGSPVRVESIVVLGDSLSNETVANGFFYYEYLAQIVANNSVIDSNTTIVSLAQPGAGVATLELEVENATDVYSFWNRTSDPLYEDSLAVVFAGHDAYKNNETLSKVISSINSSLTDLYNSGARTFAVIGLCDELTANATLTQEHNAALKAVVDGFRNSSSFAHPFFVNISDIANNSLLQGQANVVENDLLTPIAHEAVASLIVSSFASTYGNCSVCNNLY